MHEKVNRHEDANKQKQALMHWNRDLYDYMMKNPGEFMGMVTGMEYQNQNQNQMGYHNSNSNQKVTEYEIMPELLFWREPKDIEFEATSPFIGISQLHEIKEEEMRGLVKLIDSEKNVTNLIQKESINKC